MGFGSIITRLTKRLAGRHFDARNFTRHSAVKTLDSRAFDLMGYFSLSPDGFVECSSEYTQPADQLFGLRINGVFKIRNINSIEAKRTSSTGPSQPSLPEPAKPANHKQAPEESDPLCLKRVLSNQKVIKENCTNIIQHNIEQDDVALKTVVILQNAFSAIQNLEGEMRLLSAKVSALQEAHAKTQALFDEEDVAAAFAQANAINGEDSDDFNGEDEIDVEAKENMQEDAREEGGEGGDA